MTLPSQQISAITIPVVFTRTDIRPLPMSIGLPRMSRRQIRPERKRRKPDGVKMNLAEERKS
jgi:hypothetical protein